MLDSKWKYVLGSIVGAACLVISPVTASAVSYQSTFPTNASGFQLPGQVGANQQFPIGFHMNLGGYIYIYYNDYGIHSGQQANVEFVLQNQGDLTTYDYTPPAGDHTDVNADGFPNDMFKVYVEPGNYTVSCWNNTSYVTQCGMYATNDQSKQL